LSAVRDCLFNIFSATLHIWRLLPPSATRGRALESSEYKEKEVKFLAFLTSVVCGAEWSAFYGDMTVSVGRTRGGLGPARCRDNIPTVASRFSDVQPQLSQLLSTFFQLQRMLSLEIIIKLEIRIRFIVTLISCDIMLFVFECLTSLVCPSLSVTLMHQDIVCLLFYVHGFDSHEGHNFLLFATTCRPALEPT